MIPYGKRFPVVVRQTATLQRCSPETLGLGLKTIQGQRHGLGLGLGLALGVEVLSHINYICNCKL